MTTPAGWAEIAEVGRLLGAAGLTPGTTGNVSVRTADGILTSGTGTRLGALGEDDWSLVTDAGERLAGVAPTKEALLHAGIYRRRPSVGAVVHLHSPAALAVSCLAGLSDDEPIPAYTPYYVMRVRGLGMVDYFRPGHPDLAGAVELGLAERDAVLLRRHGLVTVGATLAEAVAAAEELESGCELHLRLAGLAAEPMTQAQIAELRSH